MHASDSGQDPATARLTQSLAVHAAALESLSQGVCVVDAQQRIVLFNARYIEMYNLDPAEVRVGRPLLEIFYHSAARGNLPGTQVEEYYRKRLEVMARGEPFRVLRQMPNGRAFSLSYRPIADGGWIIVVEDVTERQNQEYELRVKFERYDQAINHMSHGLCVTDADSRIVMFNQLFLDMYDMSPDVIKVGAHIRDVIEHAAQRGFFPQATPQQVWERRLEKMAPRKPFQQYQRLHGTREYVLHYHPMADGGWVTLCEDVTERFRMEHELRVQYERFDQALNHMSHGLCMFGPDERLIVCNARYLDLYGLDPAVCKPGITHRELLAHWIASGNEPGMSAEVFYERRKNVVAGKKISAMLLHLKDGRVVEATSRPTPDGGWVSAHEDVTDRLRYEDRLREQNILFDAAVGNMAQALCMYDADNRLIICNDKYVRFFNADPQVMKPGITLREAFEHCVARGTYPGMTADDLLARRLAMLATPEPKRYDQLMANGRTLEVSINTMAKGGWVGTFTDVSAERQLEAERGSAHARLREQNILFDAALENMAHALCMFDQDWRVIVHNRRFLELYGYPPEIVKPGTPLIDLVRHSVAHGVHALAGRSAEEIVEEFKQRLASCGDQLVVRRFADGRLVAVRHQLLENGGCVLTYEDITERERAAEELKEQHRRFDIALNNMAHGLCMFDEDMRLIVSNKRYAEIFNVPMEAVRPGMLVRDAIAASFAAGNYRHRNVTLDEFYDSYVTSLRAGDLTVRRHLADGRIINVTHEKMAQGGWVAIYEDVTERHRAEQSIAHMARHDALTDLPNRVLLRERMAEGLARVEAHGEKLAVLCLDLDNFKGVNDTLGHPIGDRLLGAIAERIRGAVGEGDTVARLGGDEFAILQPNASPSAAGALARRLVEVISQPVQIDGQEINSGVSIGIALAPNDGNAADHLMKCADLALYRAKAEGRGTFRFFEPDMDAHIQARRALEVDLRRALHTGEFTLAYQPQINLAGNELIAMEALLRWNHAERGSVPPSEFIPLAEEMGLIVPLGEWVLREACKDAARWPEPIKVAVNLSPVQFRNRGLVTMVTQALAAARLAPNRLELEITEAVLLQDDEAIVTMLHQLRALGVRIAMDDFGTGYSSLSYLRSFPFDKIKIDRSFIKDIDRNRDSAVIIKAIAGLGQSLGIETTAEGIETAEQLELVRRAGCTEMQGYLASPPRPAAEAAELIARFRRDVAAA
ncbi:MAG TPA: PAS-domain containing protein [Xanthobacteraceae bacterium]|nr:PAS-domain containing protein [Xanthobacteraceae bacterium]